MVTATIFQKDPTKEHIPGGTFNAAQALGAGAYKIPDVIEKLRLAVRKELDRSAWGVKGTTLLKTCKRCYSTYLTRQIEGEIPC